MLAQGTDALAAPPVRQDHRPVLVATTTAVAALATIFLLATGTMLPPAAVAGLLLATPLLALKLPIGQLHRQRIAAALVLALGAFWFVQASSMEQLSNAMIWWHVQHGSRTYETSLMAGFPIWGIEGSRTGAFPGYLPWDQGLLVLLQNFAIFAAAAWLATLWIPRRALGRVIGWGLVAAVPASVFGCLWMACIAD